jgi:glucose-6-phosphate 1-dehydrogenase
MDYREKPLLLVIFGITGDLAARKLLPALYALRKKNQLPERMRIVGLSRQTVLPDELYETLRQRMAGKDFDEDAVRYLRSVTDMVQLDMENPEDYARLRTQLHDVTKELGPGASRLYYLSIPAQAFTAVVSHLGQTGHNEPFEEDADRPRILVEKPFGYDTQSAHELIDVLNASFSEQQVFRIDHYLAKETAQNILTFRFQNPLFQSIWNARHIESIRVSAFETIGIEGRANFYEKTGALRDFLQSHLLQLLALITMENPGRLDSTNIHRAKLRLLDSIATVEEHEVDAVTCRGQYDSYRQEVANPVSRTETFARLCLTIDNEQWRGVGVTLETGKGLAEKLSEVYVRFRPTAESTGTNALVFRLQPREGITLLLQAKQPGLYDDTEEVEMDFDYAKSFGDTSEAYERVIIDAIRGEQALFASSAEVLSSWRIVENVLKRWAQTDEGLRHYAIGAASDTIV